MNLFSPDAALSNQRLNAVGGTISASAGYRFDLGNDWFFEPSASGIYSKVKIDTLNLPEGVGDLNNSIGLSPTTVRFNDNISMLGRIGARVGTTVNSGSVIWQPFATASVWHEFAGASTASYSAPAYPFGFLASDFSTNGTLSNSRVGTYGQYSIGAAAQVSGSPLLGYVRIDYRNGSNIESLGFNAGLRYNFDPTTKGIVTPGVFKAQPRMVATAYDWTGFYVGGFVGAAAGHSNWYFPPIATGVNPRTAGALGGVDAGYGKQIGSWVVGVEGDVAATNAKGGTSCISSAINFGFPVETNCNNDVRWMATGTAKLGYAWDRVLVYGKAGGAWANNALDVSCNGDPNVQFNCTAANSLVNPGIAHAVTTFNQFGWTAGIGFELALTPSWSAKAEYDYLSFGSKNVVLTDTTLVSFKQDFNQVKIGLNYRFGRPDEELAAATMPLKAKAAPVLAYNWTGGYVGAAIANRWSNASWVTDAVGNGPGFGTVIPDPTTTPASYFSANPQGRVYGGYNLQLSPKWIAGVEADAGFGDSTMRRGGIPGTFGNGANALFFNGFPGIEAERVDSSSVKLGWDASVRGKFGMVIAPAFQLYGTAGVAFQQVSSTATCDGSIDSWCGFSGIARSQTLSSVRTGWTAGGGVEGVITGNWIGKAEVRYADFGRYKTVYFGGTGDDVVSSLHVQTYTAIAGVAYKFGPTAVVAKY
jgi:opacity protein-like surface antigen